MTSFGNFSKVAKSEYTCSLPNLWVMRFGNFSKVAKSEFGYSLPNLWVTRFGNFKKLPKLNATTKKLFFVYCAVQPASTGSAIPVIVVACGDARNSAV